jgi:hypothetical protein
LVSQIWLLFLLGVKFMKYIVGLGAEMCEEDKRF